MGARAFLSRLFTRAPRPQTPTIVIVDKSWRAGDLAECIVDGTWYSLEDGATKPGPSKGERRVVTQVELSGDAAGHMVLWLTFAKSRGQIFRADQFRKIVPQADTACAADADFLPWLKRQPVREDV